MPKNHPLDPENKLSDKQYSDMVDTMQNERYADHLKWKYRWIVLKRIAIVLIVLAALYFLFMK